jgi:FMN phosphatase YigB (HAD superfamily)
VTASLLGSRGPDVMGVVCDLDDTLYPQARWLAGACDAVADRAASFGVDRNSLRRALGESLREGSDRGRTIDRALAAIGADVPVQPLVEAFRAHSPDLLEPYPGAEEALRRLSRLVPLVLLSDGDPAGQRAKLAATGLSGLFRAVVLSDELGRDHRKPDPLPFALAVEALGVPAEAVVVIGDRPDKDVAGALAAGLRALRVRTGEYAGAADLPGTWAVSDTLGEAVALLAGFVAGHDTVASSHAPGVVPS